MASGKKQGGAAAQPGRGGASRRETVEALRREQKRAERRKTALVVGTAGALGLGLIAVAGVSVWQNQQNDPSNRALSSFGVPAGEAGCDPVVEEPTSGSSVHVDPGTRVDYAQVPPSSGEHFPNWADFGRKFYTAQDRPPVEELVHNLEHGYTVLWYAEDVSDAEAQDLRDLAERVSEEPATAGKFKVTAWDASYGEFPDGKRFGITHWGADQGYRQLCGELSGEAVGDFVEAYPASNSPEPAGG